MVRQKLALILRPADRPGNLKSLPWLSSIDNHNNNFFFSRYDQLRYAQLQFRWNLIIIITGAITCILTIPITIDYRALPRSLKIAKPSFGSTL